MPIKIRYEKCRPSSNGCRINLDGYEFRKRKIANVKSGKFRVWYCCSGNCKNCKMHIRQDLKTGLFYFSQWNESSNNRCVHGWNPAPRKRRKSKSIAPILLEEKKKEVKVENPAKSDDANIELTSNSTLNVTTKQPTTSQNFIREQRNGAMDILFYYQDLYFQNFLSGSSFQKNIDNFDDFSIFDEFELTKNDPDMYSNSNSTDSSYSNEISDQFDEILRLEETDFGPNVPLNLNSDSYINAVDYEKIEGGDW